MLTPEENERLTRVGPGTPMGDVLRRYWQPAALSEELPRPGGPPIGLRLLGEDLTAFRDGDGDVLVYAPRRDTAAFYPTWEGAGIVWAYLGPRDALPAPPDYELVRAPRTHRFVSKTYEECNWVQALEGGLDTAHISFLHNQTIGDRGRPRTGDTAPRLDVERTAYGYRYAGIRKAGERQYVRAYHYIMPAQQCRGFVIGFNGKRQSIPTIHGHIWVPIDDTHTWVYNWMYSYDPAQPLPLDVAIDLERRDGRAPEELLPGYRPIRNRSNDYMIDRELQRKQTFTGITGINTQDFALQEGMGPIVDRSKEHLGTTDRAIIVMRQLLLEATDALAAGAPLRGVDPATYRNVRAVDLYIPEGEAWQEALKDEMLAKY